MSRELSAVMHRLERVERFLERVIERLEHRHHHEHDCGGVSLGGAAHRPHPIYDETAYFISTHNGG